MKRAITVFAMFVVPAISTPTLTSAQTVTVSEPIPKFQLPHLPIERDEAGVVKAQYIKPGDVTPEEYQALLAEADRIRAYQDHVGMANSYVAASSTQTEPVPFLEHVVAQGDTLYSLAKRYGVELIRIAEANGLQGHSIRLGQTLRIPTVQTNTATFQPIYQDTTVPTQPTESEPSLTAMPSTFAASTGLSAPKAYAVLPGDTLYGIAKRACVNVGDIMAMNGAMDSAIQPGQLLNLPQGHCLN